MHCYCKSSKPRAKTKYIDAIENVFLWFLSDVHMCDLFSHHFNLSDSRYTPAVVFIIICTEES